MREASVVGCGVDLVLKLDSSCAAKIHAGPGMVKKAGAGAVKLLKSEKHEKKIFAEFTKKAFCPIR